MLHQITPGTGSEQKNTREKDLKVLFVHPPCPNIIRESLPPVVEDDSGTFPPLGLLYVAAHARAVEGVHAEVLDCQAESVDHDALEGEFLRRQPDVVAIQVLTFTFIDAILVAKITRRVLPQALIVVGGPHVALYPEETIGLTEVDAAILGEGEYIFASMLQALMAGKSISGVPGVLTKENPASQCFDFLEDLDSLLMPARDLIKMPLYTSPLAVKNPVATMMSSRGCPARCTFCDRPQMGKRFRKRSARKVVEEMQICVEEFNAGEILFYDDTFTIDKKRVYEICDLIKEIGLDVSWDIRARIDTVTPEMISRLKEAGCSRIHYGVESGSEKIQKRLRKFLKMDKVREIFAHTKKEGIETLGYFMIGNPDETLDDYLETLDLLTTLPMDYAHIGIFTPYPGTEAYSEALSTGVYETDHWREFTRNPTPEFTPRHWNQFFTNEELYQMLRRAYSAFYRRPGYIISRLAKVRSLDDLYRKSVMGIKLLHEISFGRRHTAA